ncbi:MAG: AAA-type ATPase lid domain-containing protein, partial [Candidatus Binatia bacterium]
YNRGAKALSDAAASTIAQYSWPGNVRELSNVIERAVLLKAGVTIEPDDLALRTANAIDAPSTSKDADSLLTIDLSNGIVLDDLERTIIETVLGRTGWNRTRAAHLLGLSHETLRYRIEKYDLKAPSTGTDF